jgi:hypothetical protein
VTPLFRRIQKAVLHAFAIAEGPSAWMLLGGAIFTFVGVLVGWITVGEFRWPTLLIAADLMVSGFGAVQVSEDPNEELLAEVRELRARVDLLVGAA